MITGLFTISNADDFHEEFIFSVLSISFKAKMFK